MSSFPSPSRSPLTRAGTPGPAAIAADTIVAISTPPGRGGIGVVRLSGPAARAAAAPLLELPAPLEHARARFTRLLDPATPGTEDSAAVLDEAVVTFFAAPHSYTGEDVVEISTHGAPVILEHVVRTALAHGVRLARPGEFTERAFLSGRLDLTQAEAVHDLVASATLHQARTAAAQLGGSLARAIAPTKQALLDLIATLEAGIDFAEDDIDLLPDPTIAARISAIAAPLTTLEQSFRYGRVLREGASLAIVGRPNAGKSSLFNALLARDRAIVTSTPGTTRDLITEHLDLDGIPVRLTDTAGLREAGDEIEALGIARSHEALAEASLILLVLDGAAPPHPEDLALILANGDRPVLVVRNKIDLLPGPKTLDLVPDPATPDLVPGRTAVDAISNPTDSALISRPISVDLEDPWSALAATLPERASLVATSALSGVGIADLKAVMRQSLAAEPEVQSALLTSLRQHTAVGAALTALASAAEAVTNHIPHEMLLLDLHSALAALDELTGATSTEDILNRIFSTFCIGK